MRLKIETIGLLFLGFSVPVHARAENPVRSVVLEFSELGRDGKSFFPQADVRLAMTDSPVLSFRGTVKDGQSPQRLQLGYDPRSSQWTVTSNEGEDAMVRQSLSAPVLIQILDESSSDPLTVGCGYSHETKMVFYRLNLIMRQAKCPTVESQVSASSTVGFELTGGTKSLTVAVFSNDPKGGSRELLGRLETRSVPGLPTSSQRTRSEDLTPSSVEHVDLSKPKNWLKRGIELVKPVPAPGTGSGKLRVRSHTKKIV